jgi:hypothetical protein
MLSPEFLLVSRAGAGIFQGAALQVRQCNSCKLRLSAVTVACYGHDWGPWITTRIMKDERGPSVANVISVHHSLRAGVAGASE